MDRPVITAIWHPPLAADAADIREWPAGATLDDIVEGFGDALPADFRSHGDIVLGDHALDRARWRNIRVRPGQTLTLHYAPRGNRNGTKAAILGLVIAVATVVTAGWAAAGAGGLLQAGGISARLLAGGITIAGNLLRNAVSSPPVAANSRNQSGSQLSGPASLSGNVIGPGAPVPAVLGERDIYPPFVTQPLIERVGEEEVAEVVMALAGTYAISMPRIGETDVSAADDVTLQIREGRPSDLPITLVQRYGATNLVNSELPAHKTDPDDAQKIENQANPAASLPTWLSVSTASDFDEIWLHLTLPGGLARPSSEGDLQVVPFRLRMRQDSGDPWINLPEMHFVGSDVREMRPTIRMKREADPGVVPSMPSNRGWRVVYTNAPGQTAPNPLTGAWTAHSSFVSGAGSDVLYAGNEGSSNIVRVAVDGTEIRLSLDPAVFPAGRWQIEMKRGLCYKADNFTRSTYSYSGATIDFFHYTESAGEYRLARTRDGISDACYLVRCCSVVNRHPVNDGEPVPNLAQIAMQARGRSVTSFKVRASSIVDRFDGEEFADNGESALPADLYHSVLRGPLAALPLPAALIDKVSLAAWRTANVADDRRCDMICEGALVADVLTNIAGCGYARPSASEVWGVMRDYDRSAEDPVQTFTVRNSSALTMTKAFNRLPDLIRAVYSDTEGKPRELEVWRAGREGLLKPLTEEINYVGLTREADVAERAAFDLRQMELRSAVFSFNASREAIRCPRGDLIGVNHSVLDRTHGSARIRAISVDAEDMFSAIALDARVPVYNEDDMHDAEDCHAIADMHLVGLKSGVRIRRSDGTSTVHPLANPTGMTSELQLETPVELPEDGDSQRAVRRGNLVAVGSVGAEVRRFIATEITWDKRMHARFSAVAEAPELHA